MLLSEINRKYVSISIVIFFISIVSGCGIRKVQHKELITHGFETEPGNFPWHVAILHRKNLNTEYKCGGSLVGANLVITAAHCVFDSGRVIIPRKMVVHLGKHKLYDFDDNTRESLVKRIEVHPKYNASTLQNDIAKIFLSVEVSYTNFIQPICLWDRDKTELGQVQGKTGTVAGWGRTENDELSDVLREAKMPVVSSADCKDSNRNFFGKYLSNLNFCAGLKNGTSVCNGDSGGGMYFEVDGVWKLRGVVSITIAQKTSRFCSTNDFVLFTDVAQYLEWIRGPSSALEDCGRWTPRKGLLDKSWEPLIPGDFPWSVVIYTTKDGNEETRCVGSLVNSNTILTAAQCVFKLNLNSDILLPTDLLVRVGTNLAGNSSGQSFYVNDIKAHENFDQTNLENDLAYLTLSSDVTFTDNIQPICFKDFRKRIVESQPGYLAGFPFAEDRGILQMTMAKLTYQEYSECYIENEESFRHLITEKSYCAKYADPTAPCLIPGGAFAVQEDDGSWHLKGVLSVGQRKLEKENECDTSKTFMFSDVYKFSNWLYAEERFKIQTCGLRQVSKSRSSTINRGEFPWNAIIYYRKRLTLEYRCGGTLIHKNIVLTVAQCMRNFDVRFSLEYTNPNLLTVHLGKYKIYDTDLYTESMQVFKILPHPGYDMDSSINDIAILVLANAVRLSAFIQPACLWKPSLTERIDDQTLGETLSWGKLFNSEDDAEDPRRASMRIVEFYKCRLEATEASQHLSFCAGLGTETLYKADGGAGVTFDFGGISYLKGMASSLIYFEEDANYFLVFTDVEKYLSWINAQIRDYVL